MKGLFLLISIFGTLQVLSNDTLGCKCEYYSPVSLREYERKVDSISSTFIRYEDKIVIGQRNFSESDILFIVTDRKSVKGFYFDLVNNKRKTLQGIALTSLKRKLLVNKSELSTSRVIRKTAIDHDFSYFYSFDYGRTKVLHEICVSQLLTIREHPIADVFKSYSDLID